MRLPLLCRLLLALMVFPAIGRAAPDPTLEIVPNADGTMTLTRYASTGFTRSTSKLMERAMADATAYCADQHKVMKVISTKQHHPLIPVTGFAYGQVVFQAFDPNDPALTAPPPAAVSAGSATAAPATLAETPTDTFYRDLHKLDELRKDGLISEDEFEKLKTRLIEKTK